MQKSVGFVVSALVCACLLWPSAGQAQTVPGAFGKIAPSHGATSVSPGPTLSWSAADGASYYEYCIDSTNDNACNGSWIFVSSTSAAANGLSAGTTYFWQVRARNGGSTTYADGVSTAFWTFTTASVAPGAFAKTSPSNGATGQFGTTVLSWNGSAGGGTYEYCYDTTNDDACAAWTSTGSNTNAFLSAGGLTPGATYYWAVRTTNAFGTTYADGGSYWSFTRQVAPAAFTKVAPASGATGVSPGPTLSWSASSGAGSYAYCVDSTNDNACSQWNFISGNLTSATPNGLSAGTTYYWQVRAENSTGTTYADGSTTAYWSFTTGSVPPGTFGKSSPAHGTTGVSASRTIFWGSSVGVGSYEYCYDATNDNACTVWNSAGTNTSASISGLAPSTTYFWYVRATNAFGTTYSDDGVPFTFTTMAAPGVFTKSGPPTGSTGVSVAPTLSWTASGNSSFYYYCLDTTNDNACSSWQFRSGTSVTPSGLSAGTTYYWHVRAENSVATTHADGGPTAFWSFTTASTKPGVFTKSSPSNGVVNQNTSLSLQWGASAGVGNYEVCYDATNDNACSGWVSVGSTTSTFISGLNPSTIYYWYVRAVNAFGTTYADDAVPFTFTTRSAPSPFAKIGPAHGTTGTPFSVTLSWTSAVGATNYYVCYDTTNDGVCNNTWNAGSDTRREITNLRAGTTYYWQAYASSSGLDTPADGSLTAFWSFTTAPTPDPFGKLLPVNGQEFFSSDPSISWEPSTGTSGYEYCLDTTNDGACSNWIQTSGTLVFPTGLMSGATYYWQVRAFSPIGVTYANGDPSSFWSFRKPPVLLPPPCGVLSLNGTTAYASASASGYPISGAPGSVTVEAWIMPGQPPQLARFQSIVSDEAYVLVLDQFAGGVVRLGIALHPPDAGHILDSFVYDTRTIQLNQWHHVAFVYDAVTGQARFALDGVLGPPFAVTNTDFVPTGRTLTIGAAFGSLMPFNGLVDNVRVSSVARYSSTFFPHTIFHGDAHTRALYQFYQPAGATMFPDESAYGNTLTGTGGAEIAGGANCAQPQGLALGLVVPPMSTTAGGTVTVVQGTGFQPGATVTFGGAAATGVTVSSPLSMSVVVPPHAPGIVDVVVTNPDGKSATQANWFLYFAAPPGPFGKIGPRVAAQNSTTAPWLSWSPASGATRYEFCLDTTNDNTCGTGWVSTGLITNAFAGALPPFTTFYWQVQAVNDEGGVSAANGGTWWTFTTGPRTTGSDLSGDGRPDILFQNVVSGVMYAWLMGGANGATLVGEAALPTTATNWDVVGKDDFTGDGNTDILWQNTTTGAVRIWAMDGTTLLGESTLTTGVGQWRVVATGDLNADGWPDILWQQSNTNQLYAWLMYDKRLIGEGMLTSTLTAGWRVVAIADFDHDSKNDLMLQHTDGRVEVRYLDGLTETGNFAFPPTGNQWRVRMVTDFNGDGHADILWQYSSPSDLLVWFMNGTSIVAQGYTSPMTVGANWKVVGGK